MMRIGHSYDIHNLIKGNGFKIGGINIDCLYQIEAVSDGDIALHTISESILGALALGDLGEYFNEQNSKDIDSAVILNKVLDMMKNKEYSINNIDLTIVLDHPKLKGYRSKIVNNLKKLLSIREDQINVKFTTTEGNSPSTISAYCSCLLRYNLPSLD